MMPGVRSSDETIEIREGDYVVVRRLALPPPLHAPTSWSSLRFPIVLAFTVAFFVTALAGILVALV